MTTYLVRVTGLRWELAPPFLEIAEFQLFSE
jgi:hypothetical protein